MPTARPFAYNPGATGPIPGTEQIGDLAIGSPTEGFALTGLDWFNGPDEEPGYVIAQSVPDNSQPTPIDGVTASVGFFRSGEKTNQSFVDLSNTIAGLSGGGPFLSAAEAKEWLNVNGYWTSYIVSPILTNLILYYDPSNPASYPGSGTTVNDLSGNDLSGNLLNVTYTSPAFNFNGTNSTISVADNALLEPSTSDWTMEAWVNHSVITGTSRIIFAKTDGGAAQDWAYGLRTSPLGVTFGEIGNGTTSLQSNTSTLLINNWYQVVAVWTNVAENSFELFINGISQGSKSHSFTSIKNTISPLYIGSFNNGQFSQWLNGKVGAVRLYNKALSSSEVLQNFDADKFKYGL